MAVKVVCMNKKARLNYHLDERYEAGLSLLGCEVKSLRSGGADLRDAYARVRGGEVFLLNAHIAPYANGVPPDYSPKRERKLLLHKREINKLIGKTQERGFSLIPLRVYFKDGRAKTEIALARGKKLWDRREDLKRKQVKEEMRRHLGARRKEGR